MTEQQALCDFFWGTHGCDLSSGHAGLVHRCGSDDPEGPCCEYDESAAPDHRVRHMFEEWGDWGPYGDGWRSGDRS